MRLRKVIVLAGLAVLLTGAAFTYAGYYSDLDAARRTIEALVRGLERERMACEVEVFAQALRRDLIDAADFARRPGW